MKLEETQLEEIRDTLAERIREGLGRAGLQIRALPAWLPRPHGGVRGEALVVDTGGTNMRAALVEIAPDRCAVVAGPVEEPVPTGREGRTVTAREFFEAQAALVQRLSAPSGLPVGYCFSYPAETTPQADARLIKWTKGLDISGVEGHLVGRPLGEALAAHGAAPRCMRVLNDTVAALLAGAGRHGEEFDEYLGLIAGTGTNMASFFRMPDLPKVPEAAWPHDSMAVNLESGNYHPPHLSSWDDALDAAMDRPGEQRFEKAISGYYLPFLYQQVTGREDFDPSLGAGQLVELRGSGDEAAAALLARAADLVAAGLAAAIQAQGGSGRVGIVAEGSLFWKDPEFRPRVEATLGRLTGTPFGILKVEDANLIGSAFAALL